MRIFFVEFSFSKNADKNLITIRKINAQNSKPLQSNEKTHTFFSILSSFSFLELAHFSEGCGGSSSRLSCLTSLSATTPNILQISKRVCGRPTGLFPFTFASKACLGSLFWGI